MEAVQPIGVPRWRVANPSDRWAANFEPTDDEVRALNTTLGVDLKTKPPAIDVNFDRIIQADDEELARATANVERFC